MNTEARKETKLVQKNSNEAQKKLHDIKCEKCSKTF